MSPVTFIALLRGINVGGRTRIPMADLRAVCTGLGWRDVQTYIQSGNVIFNAEGDAPALETILEQALERRFGMRIPVMVRSAARWQEYVRSNAFPEASQRQANLVMLALSKAPPQAGAVERIRERATVEEVQLVDDALWIHYAGGSGRSKLTPTLLDKSVGSPVTTRNWRTVMKLEQLVSP